jgi:hypothetical protein
MRLRAVLVRMHFNGLVMGSPMKHLGALAGSALLLSIATAEGNEMRARFRRMTGCGYGHRGQEAGRPLHLRSAQAEPLLCGVT